MEKVLEHLVEPFLLGILFQDLLQKDAYVINLSVRGQQVDGLRTGRETGTRRGGTGVRWKKRLMSRSLQTPSLLPAPPVVPHSPLAPSTSARRAADLGGVQLAVV